MQYRDDVDEAIENSAFFP